MKAIYINYRTEEPIVNISHCCFFNCSASKGFFFLSNLYVYKGGAIYISSSIVPKLSNCVFSNNSCSDSGFGNDIAYNSNSIDSSAYENTCSSSSTPQVTGNSKNIILSLSPCDTSNSDYLIVCSNDEIVDESNNLSLIIIIIIIIALFVVDVLILIIIIIIFPQKKKLNKKKSLQDKFDNNAINPDESDLRTILINNNNNI
jgi:hypothetical protein